MRVASSGLWILLIYSLAHLPLFLLGDARFWDDWMIFPTAEADVRKDFLLIGLPWFADFHLFMRQFGGFGYHFCTFTSYAVAALVLPAILKFYGVEQKTAFWAAVIFAVLPINQARPVAIVVPYAMSYGLFFAGWYYMVESKDSRHETFYRLMSLAAFFVSFSTESFLVFYALPLALLLHWQIRMRPLGKSIIRNLDFIVLPIAYFAVKHSLFRPSGASADYNSIDMQNLSSMFHFLSRAFSEMLNWQSPSAGFTFILLIGSVLVMCQNRGFLRDGMDYLLHRHDRLPLEITGIIALLLALIPYCAVLRYPSFSEWENRNQLLLPLGFALLAAGAISRVRAATAKPYAFVTLTLLSIVLWHRTYADFYVDWLKQQSIVDELRNIPAIRDSKSLVVVDETKDLDVLRREYRVYDYSGLFNWAYGTQDHYVITFGQFVRHGGKWQECVKLDRPLFSSSYMMGNVTAPPPPRLLIISKTTRPYLSANHLIYAAEMIYSKWFHPQNYRENLDELIAVHGPLTIPGMAAR